jgi:neurofibromin 1
MPVPGTKKMDSGKSQSRPVRGSVSNENNILLDPEVLTDYPTQVLVLTVLVSLVYKLCVHLHKLLIIFLIDVTE